MSDIEGDDDDDDDSLFCTSSSIADDSMEQGGAVEIPIASRTVPSIPGLLVFPGLLSEHEAASVWRSLYQNDMFAGGTRNQVMLFPSLANGELKEDVANPSTRYGFPTFLNQLQDTIHSLLEPHLTELELATLFYPSPPLGRQIILNLYRPGEGITPHVDLPRRYADGIIGVCLGSGCVMDFLKEPVDIDSQRHSVYLPERTVYCMVGEARWGWQHGIAERMHDRVVVVDHGQAGHMTIPRGIRVSVTMRWMKVGADVVGSDSATGDENYHLGSSENAMEM